MTRMTEFEECSWATGRPYLSVGCWQGTNGRYREHTYRHPAGVVEIYEQTGPRPLTSMRFRHAGRDHSRTWRTTWGNKTIARLARKFIEDMAG
jgi:hypothetical protein